MPNFALVVELTLVRCSPEVWLSTLGQTFDPSLVWKKSNVFKIYDDDEFLYKVFLLAIVSDHKYSQFRPVLDVYINDTFSATLAYKWVIYICLKIHTYSYFLWSEEVDHPVPLFKSFTALKAAKMDKY